MHDNGATGATPQTQADAAGDYGNFEGFFPYHLHHGHEHGFMGQGGGPQPPFGVGGWMGPGRGGRRFQSAMMFGPHQMFPGMQPRGGRRGSGWRGRGRGGYGGRRWMGMLFDDEAAVSSMTNHLEDCNLNEEDRHSDGEESASSVTSSSGTSDSESETEDVDIVRRTAKKSSKKATDATDQQGGAAGAENGGESSNQEANAAEGDNAINGGCDGRGGWRGKNGKYHHHEHWHFKRHHGHGHGRRHRHRHMPPFDPMMMPPPPPHHGFFPGPHPHHPPPHHLGQHDNLHRVRKFKKSMKKWRKMQKKAWKLRAKMMARYCMPQFDQDGAPIDGEFDFQMPPPWAFNKRRFGRHGRRRACCCEDKEERSKRHGKQQGGRPGDEKRADGTSGDVIDAENDVEQTPMEEVDVQATEATA